MGDRMRPVALATMRRGGAARGGRRTVRWVLAAGLAAVVASEWRAWQSDLRHAVSQADAPPPAGSRPPVSVLVAAWNERQHVGRLIESFASLRYPEKELVLCAGGSDGTFDLAAQVAGPGVRLLEQRPGEGKWRALRRCLEQAAGTVVFLTDADCLLDDAAFEATLAPVLAGQAAVSTGSSVPFPEEERSSPMVAAQGDEERYIQAYAGRESLGLHGRNTAVLRKALEEACGFSGEVATGTDYALARRLRGAGHQILQTPASQMRSSYHTSMAAYSRQRSRWLRNLTLHGYAAGDWGEVRHALVTGVLGTALVVGPFAGLLAGRWVTVLWAVLFSKAVAARIRRRAAVRRWYPASRNVPDWWAVFTPLWVLLDAWTWMLSLIDLASPSRRGRW